MLTVKDFMELIEYKITDGSEYQWQCYGANPYYVAHENVDTGTTINIVFDTVDQTVYEMQAWDGPNKKEYRWINPDYLEDYVAESEERNIPQHQSIDDRKFIDLEVEKDILEKATAIFKGEKYDERIIVQLDLSLEDEHRLMKMAHERDMTLNHFVEYILMEEAKRLNIE